MTKEKYLLAILDDSIKIAVFKSINHIRMNDEIDKLIPFLSTIDEMIWEKGLRLSPSTNVVRIPMKVVINEFS